MSFDWIVEAKKRVDILCQAITATSPSMEKSVSIRNVQAELRSLVNFVDYEGMKAYAWCVSNGFCSVYFTSCCGEPR